MNSKYYINKDPLEIDEIPGFCSLLFHENIINMSQFTHIKKIQRQVFSDKNKSIHSFLVMSKNCVHLIKSDTKNYKKHINYISETFHQYYSKDCNIVDYFKFASKIIKYMDPELKLIPESIQDISNILDYF